MVAVILQILLGYVTVGFLVYVVRFSYTSYIQDLFKFLERDLSDLRRRQISKVFGQNGVFVLIYLTDLCCHLVKWPKVVLKEVKIQWNKYKIKKIQEGLSKMNRGLKKIENGKMKAGDQLLSEGRKILDRYGEKTPETTYDKFNNSVESSKKIDLKA